MRGMPAKHTRCWACGNSRCSTYVRILQFGFYGGWHKTLTICAPCARVAFERSVKIREGLGR